MKLFKLAFVTTMVMTVIEGRFVTQMTREHTRMMRQENERNFGPGLRDLHDPITGEFNHKRVIQLRGGRKPSEYLGTEKQFGIHQAFSYAHSIFGGDQKVKKIKNRKHPRVTQDWGPEGEPSPDGSDTAETEEEAPPPMELDEDGCYYSDCWLMIGDHDIDIYSWVSFMYGWTKGLMKDPESDDSVVSACYNSLFYSVQAWDAFAADVSVLDQSLGFFDMIVYHPQKLFQNWQSVYETCGGYSYITKIEMLFEFDVGYWSELITRFSIIISDQFQGFLADMYILFDEEITDWFSVGFRTGMLWKLIFDVEFEPVG